MPSFFSSIRLFYIMFRLCELRTWHYIVGLIKINGWMDFMFDDSAEAAISSPLPRPWLFLNNV